MKIGYTVLPRFDKVRAELYKIVVLGDKDVHIHLLDKEFGSIWRKPIEQDYVVAKEWIDIQIKCIKDNNANITFVE